MSRVLIVAPNWIGDTLLAQPLFARLHASRPGLALHAVAPSWTAPVLARMPEIEEVIETPLAHGRLQLGARLRLAGVLRSQRYDEAIVLPNSWKSALAPFLAGIPAAGRVRRRGTLRSPQRALPPGRGGGPADGRALRTPRRAAGRAAAAAARPAAPGGGRGESRDRDRPLRARPLAAGGCVLSRGRVRPGQALAGATLRSARPCARRARPARLADRLAGRPRDRRRDREARERRGDQSLRPHRSCLGDRPPVGGGGSGVERLGADARRGGARPAARRALRLVERRAHAAARAGAPRQPRDRMQSLLPARMPARALQVHERPRCPTGCSPRSGKWIPRSRPDRMARGQPSRR